MFSFFPFGSYCRGYNLWCVVGCCRLSWMSSVINNRWINCYHTKKKSPEKCIVKKALAFSLGVRFGPVIREWRRSCCVNHETFSNQNNVIIIIRVLFEIHSQTKGLIFLVVGFNEKWWTTRVTTIMRYHHHIVPVSIISNCAIFFLVSPIHCPPSDDSLVYERIDSHMNNETLARYRQCIINDIPWRPKDLFTYLFISHFITVRHHTRHDKTVVHSLFMSSKLPRDDPKSTKRVFF